MARKKEVKKQTKEGVKEEVIPKGKLHLFTFPLQGRSVQARNLAEAIKKIKE